LAIERFRVLREGAKEGSVLSILQFRRNDFGIEKRCVGLETSIDQRPIALKTCQFSEVKSSD
jgi:hypothetical protein